MMPIIKILNDAKLPLVSIFTGSKLRLNLDKNAQQMALGIVGIPDKDTKIHNIQMRKKL